MLLLAPPMLTVVDQGGCPGSSTRMKCSPAGRSVKVAGAGRAARLGREILARGRAWTVKVVRGRVAARDFANRQLASIRGWEASWSGTASLSITAARR